MNNSNQVLHQIQIETALLMSQKMIAKGGQVLAWNDDFSDFIADEKGYDILRKNKYFGLTQTEDNPETFDISAKDIFETQRNPKKSH